MKLLTLVLIFVYVGYNLVESKPTGFSSFTGGVKEAGSEAETALPYNEILKTLNDGIKNVIDTVKTALKSIENSSKEGCAGARAAIEGLNKVRELKQNEGSELSGSTIVALLDDTATRLSLAATCASSVIKNKANKDLVDNYDKTNIGIVALKTLIDGVAPAASLANVVLLPEKKSATFFINSFANGLKAATTDALKGLEAATVTSNDVGFNCNVASASISDALEKMSNSVKTGCGSIKEAVNIIEKKDGCV